MNDYSEDKQFYSIIKKVINKAKIESPAIAIFKEVLRLKPLIQNDISFHEFENDEFRNDGFIFNRRNYVFCCSTDDDCLSNWKYYGKGNGYEAYNIAFDANRYLAYINQQFKFNDYKCFSGMVIYDDLEKEKFISNLIHKIDTFISISNFNEEMMQALTTRIFYYIIDISLFFKNSAYKDEKEYRFVISLNNSKIKSNSLKYDFRFANDILPFLKIPFDKDIIKFIGIGPCMDKIVSLKVWMHYCNIMIFTTHLLDTLIYH